MSDTAVYCNGCYRHCKIAYMAVFQIPKDSDTPIYGITPQGLIMADIRPYCRENYVEPPQE